jgi:pilus assembly protein TadC
MQSPAIQKPERSPSPAVSSSPSPAPEGASPVKRIVATLALVVVTALAFSYLFTYAVTNELVSANVLSRWPEGTDPRPRRLLITFASMLTAFLIGSMVARVYNRRRMREIDAMIDETVEDAERILSREAA